MPALLEHLFTVPAEKGEEGAMRNHVGYLAPAYYRKPIGDVTERDRIVAATVIQWLGSNVGMAFLWEVARQIGYDFERKRQNI